MATPLLIKELCCISESVTATVGSVVPKIIPKPREGNAGIIIDIGSCHIS